MPAPKQPLSVLVVIHTQDLAVLLMERQTPTGFWQSITGSLETGESWRDAALREVEEETGLNADANLLVDWQLSNRYPIPAALISRYPSGVTHNCERVFSYAIAEPFTPRLAPLEHRQALWLPWAAAAAQTSSWTNRDAIRLIAASRI